MHSHDAEEKHLAVCLAALAGYVDVLGFLSLGGLFVSFMSGNSTRLSVAIATQLPLPGMMYPLGIIAAFLGGVMLGWWVRHLRTFKVTTRVLALTSLLLALAGVALEVGMVRLTPLLMAAAMGTLNNVFIRQGEVSIGVTYMTGTLVKFGQRLTARLLGDQHALWQPYLVLWLGLVFGGVQGGLGYQAIGLHALWAGVVFTSILTFYSAQRSAP